MEGSCVKQRNISRLVVGLIAGVTGIGIGCTADKTDPKFAADTYDEYTEPLADAVIGTPEGTTTIGASGERSFVAAAAVAVGPAGAAGVGGQGTGGRL